MGQTEIGAVTNARHIGLEHQIDGTRKSEPVSRLRPQAGCGIMADAQMIRRNGDVPGLSFSFGAKGRAN
mgnify:FL=1